MTTRGKAAFLWGVTGALVFMIGHQGYLLFGGTFLGVGPVAAVAVVVFAVTAAVAYLLEGRLAARVDATDDGGQ